MKSLADVTPLNTYCKLSKRLLSSKFLYIIVNFRHQMLFLKKLSFSILYENIMPELSYFNHELTKLRLHESTADADLILSQQPQ